MRGNLCTVPERCPQHPGRSLLTFYVILGIAVVLFGLLVLLYRPLSIRYAIYRFQKAPSYSEVDDWSLQVLQKAARNGHRKSFEALFSAHHAPMTFVVMEVPRLPRERREIFYDIVDKAPDSEAIVLLEWLAIGIQEYIGDGQYEEWNRDEASSPVRFVNEMLRLRKVSNSPQAVELTSEFISQLSSL